MGMLVGSSTYTPKGREEATHSENKRRIGLLADACAEEEKTCLNEPASYTSGRPEV